MAWKSIVVITSLGVISVLNMSNYKKKWSLDIEWSIFIMKTSNLTFDHLTWKALGNNWFLRAIVVTIFVTFKQKGLYRHIEWKPVVKLWPLAMWHENH